VTTDRNRSQAEWALGLESDDESVVISALHEACPCSGSFQLYEEFMPILNRFKKDTRPAVRAVALHLEVDALGRLNLHDEQAAGWVRNRPGGQRRGEIRNKDIRDGFR
jgi:hypothetical protein